MTFVVDRAGVTVRAVVLPPLGEVPAPEARVRAYVDEFAALGHMDTIDGVWTDRGKWAELTLTDLRDVLAELHAYRAVVEAIGLLPVPACGVGLDPRCDRNACGFPCMVRR